MKKTIAWLLIFSFGLALAAFAPARAEELEKILSPDQIKYYQVMKKEGNALYGLRRVDVVKENGTTTVRVRKDAEQTVKNDSAKVDVNSKLEKIAAPSLIPMYEKIRKIENALWGVKKEKNASSAMPARKPVAVSATAAACVATAIKTKDEALSTQIGAAATEMQAAILARSSCQQAAVLVTENQRAELEACVKTFREANRTIAEKSKKVHKEAWDAFKTALKTCQPALEGAEGKSELIIEDGSENTSEIISSILE